MVVKKGFTLIELLAVIAVLAIILIIAIPSVISIINDVKANACVKNEDMAIVATRNYLSANQNLVPNNIGDTVEVSFATLLSNSYISNIKDPYTGNDCGGYVLVSKDSSGFSYTPYLKCDTAYNTLAADGLVAHYKLDGDALDATTNNIDGALAGGMTSTTNRFGQSGKAMNFDGVDDYINLGVNPFLTTTSITLMAWVKADTLPGWSGIISNMTSWGTGFSMQMGPTQRAGAMVSGGYLSTTWVPVTNTWYYITATHDNATNLNVVYINGIREASSTQAISYEANAKTYIGVFYTAPNLLWDGTIDDVKIYNRALTANEVKHIYEVERNISR